MSFFVMHELSRLLAAENLCRQGKLCTRCQTHFIDTENITHSQHFFRDAGWSVQIEDVSLAGLSFSIFTCPLVTVEGRPHTWGQLHNTGSVRVCVRACTRFQEQCSSPAGSGEAERDCLALSSPLHLDLLSQLSQRLMQTQELKKGTGHTCS